MNLKLATFLTEEAKPTRLPSNNSVVWWVKSIDPHGLRLKKMMWDELVDLPAIFWGQQDKIPAY